jgi:hypothetical protein
MAKALAVQRQVIPLSKDNVAVEIGNLYRKARGSAVESLMYAHACGRKLSEQKDKLAHGQWLPWLSANEAILGFGERTAQKLCAFYESNPTLESDLLPEEAATLLKKLWGHQPKALPKPTPKKSTRPKPGTPQVIEDEDPDWEEDTPPDHLTSSMRRRGLLHCARGEDLKAAEGHAEGFLKHPEEIDEEIVEAVSQAAVRWQQIGMKLSEALPKRKRA